MVIIHKTEKRKSSKNGVKPRQRILMAVLQTLQKHQLRRQLQQLPQLREVLLTLVTMATQSIILMHILTLAWFIPGTTTHHCTTNINTRWRHQVFHIFTLNAKHQSFKLWVFFVFSPFLGILLLKRYLIKLVGLLGPFDLWSLLKILLNHSMVPGDFETL